MLLAKLLCTLSEDEIKKIREEFRLTERSHLIFERIAASSSSPPDSSSIAKAFRISIENFYSICSEIVGECIRILAPHEEFRVLKFLRSKYLYRPFVTELKRLEKELLRTKADRSVLERFYHYAFHEGSKFPTGVIDLDLYQELGMKWHASQISPPIDEDLFITMRVLYSRIAALTSHKKMTLAQMKEQAEKLLKPFRTSAARSPNPRARCEYYQAEWKACVFDRSHLDKGIEWLKKSLDLTLKNPEWFGPEWHQILELLIANELALFCGKAKEGFLIFQKYYRDQTPETPRGALFLFRYARVAFLAREFAKTKEILDRLDQFQIVRSTPEIYKITILLRANLELIEGELDAASGTIEEARNNNSEHYFLDHEVVIRGLETIIAFKRGDFELADQLVQRNIKWHHIRRISLSSSAWIHYYNVIAGIIRYRQDGKPLRDSLLYHFKNNFGTEHPDFYMLLEGEIA